MLIKQLSVFLQNKPGHLAKITQLLKDYDISIKGINVSEGNEFGILRLIVDDIYKAEHVLRHNDFLCKITNVLALEPEDRVGSFNEIFSALSIKGINISYIYSVIRPVNGDPVIIIKTSKQDEALKIIQSLGVKTLTEKELS